MLRAARREHVSQVGALRIEVSRYLRIELVCPIDAASAEPLHMSTPGRQPVWLWSSRTGATEPGVFVLTVTAPSTQDRE